VDFADVTEHASLHQFHDASRAVVGMTLVAHLGDDLGLGRDLPHQARFPDRVRERLLAIDVFTQLHRHHGREGVMMVRRAHGHRVDLLHFLQHFAVISEELRLGKLRPAFFQSLLVHVAQGHDILRRTTVDVRGGLASGANRRDVQLFVRGNPPRFGRGVNRPSRQQQAGGCRGGSLDETAACQSKGLGGHGLIRPMQTGLVKHRRHSRGFSLVPTGKRRILTPR
jgi:hypothetical protein